MKLHTKVYRDYGIDKVIKEINVNHIVEFFHSVHPMNGYAIAIFKTEDYQAYAYLCEKLYWNPITPEQYSK